MDATFVPGHARCIVAGMPIPEVPRATVVTPVESAAHSGGLLHSVPLEPEGAPKGSRKKVRIAAVGDLHLTRTPPEAIRPVLAYANERADILVLCGDLTD
jgi:hypothetical protein